MDHSMMNVFCLFAAQVEFFEFFVKFIFVGC